MTADDDDRLADALCEFLSAQDTGRPLAPDAWLSRHPDIAPDLRKFLGATGVESLLRATGPAERREIDLASGERFLGDYELLERWQAQERNGIRLTARGRLLSNEVFSRFLDLGVPACSDPT